ncbi:MAG TPA: glycosyltransferase family 2 protein [Candidatus Saccharimonadales bacterium]|nr:glycosyltransferase family 2 protein [Candidatus Saccharimonadales bacterium]
MVKQFVERYDRQVHRFLEILPGTFSWTLILFPVWGSFWLPHYVAYFIILFDVFWFYKSASMALSALVSHLKLNASKKYDWLADAKKLPEYKKLHHLIVIPTYKEPLHTLVRGIDSLAAQDVGPKQISIAMAFEDREGAEARDKAKEISKKYKGKFANLIITYHPDISGEVKGKSSNEAYAGKYAKKILVDKQKRNIDFITVTSKDADAELHEKFLSCLSYKFLTSEHKYLLFWQPIILFYSNIWRVPAPIRMMNSLGSVVHTGQASRTDKLVNFSCYSLSLKLLHEVGYWDVDVIPEDYRLFFKSYFQKAGKIEVDPLFLPVSADAAESTTYFKSIMNFYEQEKRWAWGVSDDSYFIKNWLTHTEIPFWQRTTRVFRVAADHFLWPVNWFIITLGANIPVLLNPAFAQTVMGQNLPKISFGILTTCWVFLAIIIIIDMRQRPKRQDATLFKKIILPFEYLMMPVVTFIFTALPGIDAHTRLMLGKYLEYRVTEKV